MPAQELLIDPAAQERRIDPADGKTHTLDELFKKYRNQYAAWQIRAYWFGEMRPEAWEFRFDQGDRVLCNVGERRLAGKVLSRDVEDPEGGENLAYVVKTDALPGFPARNLSVPADEDEVVCRDRCFHAQSELGFTRWAAPIIKADQRKPLRFSLNERVVIRIQDNGDGFEQWVCGQVLEIWPSLPFNKEEGFLKSADAVPYAIAVEGRGAFYCHRDEHTLIRHPDNVPRTPGKRITPRFEKRKRPDGTMEEFDHLTLRSKMVMDSRIEMDDKDED